MEKDSTLLVCEAWQRHLLPAVLAAQRAVGLAGAHDGGKHLHVSLCRLALAIELRDERAVGALLVGEAAPTNNRVNTSLRTDTKRVSRILSSFEK